MRIVADASPLILLARIDCLEILQKLYSKILVPESVLKEVVEDGKGLPASQEVGSSDWVETHAVPTESRLFLSLHGDLGAGEAQAITLAVSLEADLLLIDERQGRRAARTLGLAVKGTLGVLLAAKRAGHLSRIQPQVEALRKEGAWFSTHLEETILKAADEA